MAAIFFVRDSRIVLLTSAMVIGPNGLPVIGSLDVHILAQLIVGDLLRTESASIPSIAHDGNAQLIRTTLNRTRLNIGYVRKPGAQLAITENDPELPRTFRLPGVPKHVQEYALC